jgi:hypothetical protein
MEDKMSMSPMLLLHICAGTLGVLSGYVAVSFRKGSPAHSRAGTVFAISMLTLGASGAYMATVKFQPGNILGGTLTFYLVATAWMAVRHSNGRTRIFDGCALLVVLAVAAVELAYARAAAISPTGLKYGYSPGPYITFGLVALLAAVGDVRMMWRGGILRAQRIARHLWRMCFAFFIACASLFLARPHLFPVWMRKTGILALLSFLPLLLMIFWLVRVLFTRYGKGINLQSWNRPIHRIRQSSRSPALSPAGREISR